MTSDDKARLQLDDLRRVLDQWGDALLDADSDHRARDSAILRFELAYEVAWRLARTLSQAHGLTADSPRAAFSNAFRLGWTTQESIWIDVIRARNEAVLVYHEDLARRLVSALPGYLAAFRGLAASVASELGV